MSVGVKTPRKPCSCVLTAAVPLLTTDHHASIYVVRKIRASITEGEQLEKPIVTPCSAVADMRQRNELRGNVPAAALSSALEDDVRGAVSLGTPSNTALEKCGT